MLLGHLCLRVFRLSGFNSFTSDCYQYFFGAAAVVLLAYMCFVALRLFKEQAEILNQAQ